jgi:hypothetical protein
MTNKTEHMCPCVIRQLHECCAAEAVAERDALKAELAEANAIIAELRSGVRVMQETINGHLVKGVRHGE